ncbi:MAG: S41 family peptidase, partial [Thermomicrobiales bacterium]
MKQRLIALLLALMLLAACGGGGGTATPPPPTATTAPAATATTAVSTATSTSASTSTAASAVTTSAAASTSATTSASSAATSATSTTAPATTSNPAAAASPTFAPGPITGTPVPNTSPDAAEALIEQAVGLLQDHYVDPLNSGDLYGAAYTGAVKALQAAGQPAQQQALVFKGDAKQDAATFKTAYLALATKASADVNQTLLAYEAIQAMTIKINECHTAFLDPQQFQSVTAGLEGTNTYGGIGVSIRTQTRPVTIGDIFPDTPAAKSGLQPGDAIIKVNGVDVSNLTADQISPLVRGQVGTPVTLTVQRPGQSAPLDITMTREQITVPVFTTKVVDGPNGAKIGYMKLYSFSSATQDGTATDKAFQQALDSFEKQGVTGWVLDLRDNGGGYIDTLAKIASRFLKNGEPVAYRIERGGAEEPIATDPSLYFTPQHPFAILINGGSASASEALSAAAADYGFARLFGQKTAGCLAGATNYRLAD